MIFGLVTTKWIQWLIIIGGREMPVKAEVSTLQVLGAYRNRDNEKVGPDDICWGEGGDTRLQADSEGFFVEKDGQRIPAQLEAVGDSGFLVQNGQIIAFVAEKTDF